MPSTLKRAPDFYDPNENETTEEQSAEESGDEFMKKIIISLNLATVSDQLITGLPTSYTFHRAYVKDLSGSVVTTAKLRIFTGPGQTGQEILPSQLLDSLDNNSSLQDLYFGTFPLANKMIYESLYASIENPEGGVTTADLVLLFEDLTT